MRAQAGFHGDDAWRQLLEDVLESQSLDPSSEGNLPIGGEPDEVKHFLADVDADDHW
jgi:hypothetical protein